MVLYGINAYENEIWHNSFGYAMGVVMSCFAVNKRYHKEVSLEA